MLHPQSFILLITTSSMSGNVITVAVTCETCARTNENTPLIRHGAARSTVNYFYICVLMLILVVGFSIGCYLLYKDKEWDEIDNYPFIIKAFTDHIATHEVLLPLDLPLRHIHLFELPDEFRCHNKYDCLLQLITTGNDTLKTYNFVVDNKLTIYEGLGWNHRCGNCDDHTLTIATFNISDDSDSTRTTKTVSSILDRGIRIKKLDLCFTISYVGNRTNFKEFTNYVMNDSQRSIECSAID